MVSRLSNDGDPIWNDHAAQMRALESGIMGLRQTLDGESHAAEETFGSLLLLLVNLARLAGFRAEDVLHERLRKLEEKPSFVKDG
jgi:hypothetical protein